MKSKIIILAFMLFSFSVNAKIICEKGIELPGVPTLEEVNPMVQISLFCNSYKECRGESDSFVKDCIDEYKEMKDECGGVSPVEMQSIKFYTGSGYSYINRSIWNKTKKCEGVIQVLNTGLSRLPNYKGWVMRGASLPESVRKEHVEGQDINYPAFTSSSTSNGWDRNDNFLIYSETGKSINDISTFKGEDEVLFRANTSFRILKIIKVKDKNMYVMVENIEGLNEEESNDRFKDLELSIDDIVHKLEFFKSNPEHLPYSNLFSESRVAGKSKWTCDAGLEEENIFPEFLGKSIAVPEMYEYVGFFKRKYGNEFNQKILESINKKLEKNFNTIPMLKIDEETEKEIEKKLNSKIKNIEDL